MSLPSIVQCLSAMNCWLKCMMLDPYNQTDHPECRTRPDSGLSAITELDPGYITGKWCCSITYISPGLFLVFPPLQIMNPPFHFRIPQKESFVSFTESFIQPIVLFTLLNGEISNTTKRDRGIRQY